MFAQTRQLGLKQIDGRNIILRIKIIINIFLGVIIEIIYIIILEIKIIFCSGKLVGRLRFIRLILNCRNYFFFRPFIFEIRKIIIINIIFNIIREGCILGFIVPPAAGHVPRDMY